MGIWKNVLYTSHNTKKYTLLLKPNPMLGKMVQMIMAVMIFVLSLPGIVYPSCDYYYTD